jgi:hypothetical protein
MEIGMQKSSVYHELIEAMGQPGCPVCQLIDRAVRQYVDVFFYENITNVERRAEIRAARGYCSVHGALLGGHSRMLGVAIIQHDVINDVLREINKTLTTTEPAKGGERRRRPRKLAPLDDLTATPLRNTMSNAIKPKRDCPLCGYERDRERNLLRALINEIHTPEMRAAFEHSSGLCLPHANAALQLRGVSADGLRLMMQIERDILQRLKAELDEYLVKSNGSYDYEGMGTEADAPVRAVKLVSGRVFGRR